MIRRLILFVFVGCLLCAAPSFADQTNSCGTSCDQKTIAACQTSAWQAYEKTARAAVRSYRDLSIAEWQRQVGFRLRAAATESSWNTRARILNGDRALYERKLDQFVTLQDTRLATLKTEAMTRIPSSDDPAAGFESFATRPFGASPIESLALRMEYDLYRFASTEDKALIKKYFRERRAYLWNVFTTAIRDARRTFAGRYFQCMPAATPQTPSTAASGALTPLVTQEASSTFDYGFSAVYTTTTPPDFRVVGASISVAPQSSYSCVRSFTINATITASKDGVVSYGWEGDNGLVMPTQDVRVIAKSPLHITKTFGAQGPYTGWRRLRITAPNTVLSNTVRLDAPCLNPTASSVVTGATAALTTAPLCGKPARFSGSIFANATGTVAYVWIRSDGIQSDRMEVNFTQAGSQKAAPLEWTVPGSFTKGWAQIRVLSPNQAYSEQVPFEVSCNQLEVLAATTVVTSTNQNCLVGPTIAGTIRTNIRSSSVKYVWEYEDGFISATQTAMFLDRTTSTVITVTSSRAIAPNTSMWVRLRTITPNRIVSDPTTFRMVCEPLRVTSAILNSDATTTVMTCGTKTFSFTGKISTNKAGPITYRFDRSDGVSMPPQAMTFFGAESRTVSTTWMLGGDFSGWVKLHVTSPNELISVPPASFQLKQTCQ